MRFFSLNWQLLPCSLKMVWCIQNKLRNKLERVEHTETGIVSYLGSAVVKSDFSSSSLFISSSSSNNPFAILWVMLHTRMIQEANHQIRWRKNHNRSNKLWDTGYIKYVVGGSFYICVALFDMKHFETLVSMCQKVLIYLLATLVSCNSWVKTSSLRCTMDFNILLMSFKT